MTGSSISSTSSTGQGAVTIQLADGADATAAAAEAERRVAAIRGQLPSDAGAPSVNKADPNASPVLNIALVSKTRQLSDLYDIASNTVQPKLLAVNGVANASLVGGLQQEVQVQVDLTKLTEYGVTFQEIQSAIARENVDSPGGSETQNGQTNVNIRTSGRFQRIDDLKNIIISTGAGGAPIGQVSAGGGIRLGDVANAVETYKDRTQIQRLDGADAVGISITKQSDANSLQVADDVRAQLNRLKSAVPDDVQLVVTNDSSRFTRSSLDAVQTDLSVGIALTALVLLVFLHSWRNVVIVTLAIPTSLISTFIALYALNLSLDTISLMALALVIGILVDDSIVVIENIHRHLHLGEAPLMAALNGRSEIGLAAISITAVDVVVYLPIAFMAGNLGQLFREYALVIAIATLLSLFISFTLTPMLASRFLSASTPDKRPGLGDRFGQAFDAVWDRFANGYGWLLHHSLRARPLVVLIAVAALAGSIALVPLHVLATEYSPTEDDNQLSVNVQMPPGTSLDATDNALRQVEAILRTIPEVSTTFTSVRSGGGGFGGGGSSGSVSVDLVDKRKRTRSVFDIANEIRQKGRSIPGANIQVSVQNPLLGGGGGGGLQLRLQGDDYTVLQQLSNQVAQVVRGVPGVVDVRPAQVVGGPEVQAIANREQMADLGVSQQTVASTVRTAIAGTQVGSFAPANQLQQDITLIAQPSDRSDLTKLGDLPVPTSAGFTRLSQIATLQNDTGPATINRTDRQRVVSVSANVAGRPLGDVATDVRAALKTIRLPDGYQIVVGGSVQSLDTAFATLASTLGLSVVLIYMLMVALFGSLLYPLVIMFALPVAIVGAFLGLVVTSNMLNLYSMLGIIMLMGLVAKNGILLVDYTNTLRRRGHSRQDAILEAGPTRLKPIVMTTATIVMAMIPLALKLEAGAESRAPLAVVVMGGVLSSTLLTLFLVPTMYTYLDDLSTLLVRIFRRDRTPVQRPQAMPRMEPVAEVAEG